MSTGRKPEYRLSEKQKAHVATGSPFDSTRPVGGNVKVGQLKYKEGEIDVTAFSYQKNVPKPSPTAYLKKNEGAGGKGSVEATEIVNSRVEEMSRNSPKKTKAKSSPFQKRPNPPNTNFRKLYERADLPIRVDQNGSLPKIAWSCPLDRLDYHHYLPLFFEGLRETEYPYKFLAEAGTKDLLSVGGNRILPVVPQLIVPIKDALNTRDPEVMVRVIRILQALVLADVKSENPGLVGQALVPFYRQILPVLAIFKECNENIGDSIDYSQNGNKNLGDLIEDTLGLLERYGGKDAFINIKYLIPTYQSCVL